MVVVVEEEVHRTNLSLFEDAERDIWEQNPLPFEAELVRLSSAGHGRTGICQIVSAHARLIQEQVEATLVSQEGP